jgi:beta-mannosidase
MNDVYPVFDKSQVWQDFLFGCGQYPAHDAMIESVKLEAEQAVKRLRNHPSIVIFVSSFQRRSDTSVRS